MKILIVLTISLVTQISYANDCLSMNGLGLIADGAAVTGYKAAMGVPGIPCEQKTIFCLNGAFTDLDLYPSCIEAKK